MVFVLILNAATMRPFLIWRMDISSSCALDRFIRQAQPIGNYAKKGYTTGESAYNAKLLAMLPGVMIQDREDNDMGKKTYFRFDGGGGVVMPCRRCKDG